MTNSETPEEAIKHLTNNQRQLDMDGCEVGVSRQALDEVLDYISRTTPSAQPVASGAVDLALRDAACVFDRLRNGKPGDHVYHLLAENCRRGLTALAAQKAVDVEALKQEFLASDWLKDCETNHDIVLCVLSELQERGLLSSGGGGKG